MGGEFLHKPTTPTCPGQAGTIERPCHFRLWIAVGNDLNASLSERQHLLEAAVTREREAEHRKGGGQTWQFPCLAIMRFLRLAGEIAFGNCSDERKLTDFPPQITGSKTKIDGLCRVTLLKQRHQIPGKAGFSGAITSNQSDTGRQTFSHRIWGVEGWRRSASLVQKLVRSVGGIHNDGQPDQALTAVTGRTAKRVCWEQVATLAGETDAKLMVAERFRKYFTPACTLWLLIWRHLITLFLAE